MTAENKKSQQKKINAQMGQALFSDTERFEMWFSTYWKPAAGAAVAVAILCALVFWGVTASEKSAKNAAFMLTDASTVETLEAALKAHASHPGAPIARYRLAKLLIDAKKYQDAVKQLDLIAADTNADKTLAAQAKLTSGYANELANECKKAIASFLAVESNADYPAALRAEAGYSAGRLLIKTGDTAQAKSVLGRTGLLGSANAGVGYWTENAKNTLIALENGEYKPAAKPAAKPAKK